MSCYEEYDAPLRVHERVRIEALKLTASPGLEGDAWVDAARPLEHYVIGQRATDAKERIYAAYTLSCKLLEDAARREAWAPEEDPDTVPVTLADLRDLIQTLSALAGGPPF